MHGFAAAESCEPSLSRVRWAASAEAKLGILLSHIRSFKQRERSFSKPYRSCIVGFASIFDISARIFERPKGLINFSAMDCCRSSRVMVGSTRRPCLAAMDCRDDVGTGSGDRRGSCGNLRLNSVWTWRSGRIVASQKSRRGARVDRRLAGRSHA